MSYNFGRTRRARVPKNITLSVFDYARGAVNPNDDMGVFHGEYFA